MPDVIAKIATSDDFQKIAKHVLKLRKCAALGPMIGILVYVAAVPPISLPVCVVNRQSVVSFSVAPDIIPQITRVGAREKK